MQSPTPISLSELASRVSGAVAAAPGLSGVWVVAETSDLRLAGGHCYMELIEKDPASGKALARMRAMIWASRYSRLADSFLAATGCRLASDIRIMVQLSVAYHPLYGLSATITDINPEYTLGDLLRRRREFIERLTREGIINENRRLPWPAVPQRIAVISARGAAGYGDFINQLYTNRYCLRFTSQLFPAVMQGENAAPSIIAALEALAAQADDFDCVVIIRGGGATGDLAAFDDYRLAATIALFPLPVIIGIGHERDITLLDYVANMRVKTPTAAAEWLVGRGVEALNTLRRLGTDILTAASAAASTARRRLDVYAAGIPLLTRAVIERNRNLVGPATADVLSTSLRNSVTRRRDRLDALAALIDTLSPQATLRRGFSITRVGGKAVTDPGDVPDGSLVESTLAGGILISVVHHQSH